MSTFILRLRTPASGEVRGVVEHVSDGSTTAITNMAELEAFLIQRRPLDDPSHPETTTPEEHNA